MGAFSGNGFSPGGHKFRTRLSIVSPIASGCRHYRAWNELPASYMLCPCPSPPPWGMEGRKGRWRRNILFGEDPFPPGRNRDGLAAISKRLSEDFPVRTKVRNPCLFLMVFSGERTLILSQLRQGRTVASGLTTPWFNTALVYSVLALCIHVVWWALSMVGTWNEGGSMVTGSLEQGQQGTAQPPSLPPTAFPWKPHVTSAHSSLASTSHMACLTPKQVRQEVLLWPGTERSGQIFMNNPKHGCILLIPPPLIL